MTPISALGLSGSGQIGQTPAVAAAKNGPSSFETARLGPSGETGRTAIQASSGEFAPPPPNSLQSAAAPTAAVLGPKVQYTATALSDLRGQVSALDPTSSQSPLRSRLQLLETQFVQVGTNIDAASSHTDAMQILKLQHEIYQIDEEVELLSKVVEQATSGVKSVLQMQV